jgi:uncharacterized protein
MSRIVVLAALLAPVVLAACGHSPQTQFLTLDATPAASSAVVDYRGPPVRIPAVRIPPALDRVEFIRQTAPGEMRVDDLTQWSASLGLLARNTLILDLAERLPSGAVSPPDTAAQPGGLRASVAILSFGVVGNDATMEVAYDFISDDGPDAAGPRHWAKLSTASAGQNPLDTARAFSALLGALADRMAGDLAARSVRR